MTMVPTGVPMKMLSTQHHWICLPKRNRSAAVWPRHVLPGLDAAQAASSVAGTVANAACVVALLIQASAMKARSPRVNRARKAGNALVTSSVASRRTTTVKHA